MSFRVVSLQLTGTGSAIAVLSDRTALPPASLAITFATEIEAGLQDAETETRLHAELRRLMMHAALAL